MSFCFLQLHPPILTLRSPQAILNCSLGVTKHNRQQTAGRYVLVLHFRIIHLVRVEKGGMFLGQIKRHTMNVAEANVPLCMTASLFRGVIHPCPFSRMLGGPHCRSWRFGDGRNILLRPEIEFWPQFPYWVHPLPGHSTRRAFWVRE